MSRTLCLVLEGLVTALALALLLHQMFWSNKSLIGGEGGVGAYRKPQLSFLAPPSSPPTSNKGQGLKNEKIESSRRAGPGTTGPDGKRAKTVLLWTNLMGYKKGIWTSKIFRQTLEGQCPVSECSFTLDPSKLGTADAVLFYIINVFRNQFEFPNRTNYDQLWILVDFESTVSTENALGHGPSKHLDYSKLNNRINMTMHFRRDADITIYAGRTSPRKGGRRNSGIRDFAKTDFSNYTQEYHAGAGEDPDWAPIVWFSSHEPTASRRERFVAALSRHIGVHKYGKRYKRKCLSPRYIYNSHPLEDGDPCFKLANANYRFILALENSICKDYASEKVFNALRHNLIPIVLTGQLPDDEIVFPPHSVINIFQFESAKEVSEYLYYLLANQTAYDEYFSWRRNYDLESFYSLPNTCELCEKLHAAAGNKYTISNITKWYHDDAECIWKLGAEQDGLFDGYHRVPIEKDPIVEQWKNKRKKIKQVSK